MASSNDASVGMEPAGTTASGRKIAAMEKPLATRTLIAVTSEASRIAFIVVIDFAFRSRCQTPQPSGRFNQLHNRLHNWSRSLSAIWRSPIDLSDYAHVLSQSEVKNPTYWDG